MESVGKNDTISGLDVGGSTVASTILRWLAIPRVWVMLSVIVVLVAHWPFPQLSLEADDYLLWGQLKGSENLADKGFYLADPDRPLLDRLLYAFHFYSDQKDTNAIYHRYGNLPWWSSEHALMNPLRPLAAVTHWLDFQVFDSNVWWIGFMNLAGILLLWWGGFSLFRRLTGSVGLACVMAMFLVFDFSVSVNFNWLAARNSYIATGLGALTLLNFIAWREENSIGRFLLALALYVVSLLTAEASIALLGYLGAYALVMDKRGWFKGGLAVVPFLAVTIGWRMAYNAGGFGSDNIGLYVDPGRGLGEFFEQLLVVFPCISASLITGVDSLISPLSWDIRFWVRVGAWCIAVFCVYLARYQLFYNATARFMFLGSLVAVIPHASLLSAGSRSATFVALGFFYVMVLWLKSLWDARVKKPGLGWMAAAFTTWHVGIPALLAILVGVGAITIIKSDDKLFDAAMASTGAANTHSLVVVNHPTPTKLFYIPFEWDYMGRPVPETINALAPGMTRLTLTRESERVFLVTSIGPMAVNHTVDLTDANDIGVDKHRVYSYQLLQGLFTTPEQRYSNGVSWVSGSMKVTPVETEAGIPQSVRVEFDTDESPNAMNWVYYDWESQTFQPLKVPKVGESRVFGGPFDS